MKKYQNVHLVYGLLMSLTLIAYYLGGSINGSYLATLVVVGAFIKGVLIIRDFMGVKNVALIWPCIMFGWLSITCLAILIIYLFGLSNG